MKNLIIICFSLLGLLSCTNPLENIEVVKKCPNGLVFRVKSTLPLSTRLYKCELISEDSKKTLLSFQSMVNNIQFIKINDLDAGQRVQLRIADIAGSNVAVSEAVESCSETPTEIDISSFSVPVAVPRGEVTITLLFPCPEIDVKKLPALELYSRCRISGTTQWFDLPVLKYSTTGKNYFSISTKLLKVGTVYDFQVGAAPGYYAFTENNVRLENEDWVIEIGTELFCK